MNEEQAPAHIDLLWALTKPIDEMSLEEQLEALQRIRELRKVRLTVSKKKTELDMMLEQLTPDRAASLLKQLKEQMEAASAAAVSTEEKK